ncbi:MAG: ornithine cyclodeaminase family protein [Burkholderiales bacterium]|nr:ornithine cyclodeaminase family protein [Burkholderiales bacterium]
MLILTNDDVAKLLTMAETIDALRISNREVAQFRDSKEYRINRARTNHYLPWPGDGDEARRLLASGTGEDARIVYNFKSMEGGSPHFGVWAVRSSSDLVRLESGPLGLTHTYMRYGQIPGGKGYSDLIFLYGLRDAQFEAIVQSAVLQGMRVAATTALGTDYMCRHDVRTLAVFGSGWQARSNARAMLHIRPGINQVYVFSPSPQNRRQYASSMGEELGVEVIAADTPEQAVNAADVILEASSARTPVFDGAWLRPGQFITSVGGGDEHFQRRPIDPAAVARCARVAVHSLEVHYGNEEIADCVAAGELKWEDVPDLPALVTGAVRWPESDREIRLFKNNVGLGSQFAAVGGHVLAKAKKAGLGFHVPQELVAQLMRR